MVDTKTLPIEKRKQIFKKKDRRDVKHKIKELRLQSLKLKKKNLGQKAEKKEIAHQIKDLKAQLNTDGTGAESSDE